LCVRATRAGRYAHRAVYACGRLRSVARAGQTCRRVGSAGCRRQPARRLAWLLAPSLRKGAPDGYTMLRAEASASPVAAQEQLQRPQRPHSSRSPQKAYLVRCIRFLRNRRAVLALAKQKPGQINFGASVGSGGHLSGELFKLMTGANRASRIRARVPPLSVDRRTNCFGVRGRARGDTVPTLRN
jgi:hypothetical protein